MKSLSPTTKHLIRRLLATGFTRHEIAQKVGVSPASITRINRGKDRPKRPSKPLELDDLPPGYDPSQIKRCNGCGNQVYLWPCLKCRLADIKRRRAAQTKA